jgi:alkaline phosphatase D
MRKHISAAAAAAAAAACRNPNKHEIKNIYLDGIGERRDSPRRGSNNGLQTTYTLPGPGSSSSSSSGLVDEIQLVLLDERYFRETLPCSIRRDW